MKETMLVPDMLQQAWDLFTGDAGLVHGEKSIASAVVPPDKVGVYSIRLLKEPITDEQRARTKVLLLSCMDQRVVRQLYDQLLAQGYKEDEIMTLSMGGGAVHTPERRQVLKQVIDYVLGPDGLSSEVVEKVIVSGHDQVCGAAKFYGGGEKPLHEVVNMDEGQLMAGLIVGGYEELIPEAWRGKAEVGLAHVNDSRVEWQPIDMTAVKSIRVEEVLR